MNTNKKVIAGVSLLMFALAVLLPTRIGAQTRQAENAFAAPTVYTGTVVSFSGFNENPTQFFTLELTGETPADEVKKDFQILKSKGQDGFMKAIEKCKLGYFAFEGQVGQDIKYVTETRTETGRKIIIVFERWIEPFELRYGSNSVDYPFTYIELFIDDNGIGAGSLISAARVKVDKKYKNMPNFENFGAYPAKLIGVHSDNKKTDAE